MHTVISIGSHHSTGLVTDQRIYIQEKYLPVIRQLCDFCISGFDSFVGDIVPLFGAFRCYFHDGLQIDHRIRLQFLQMLYRFPVSLHKRFHCAGTHFVDTDHQIDLGKLLLRQSFLHRDLFLLSRHRYDGTVEHLVDCQSGGSIKRGCLLQPTVLIHTYRPGIPDKYRIIKITVIHRVIDHFLRCLFHRNRRGGILRLCSGGLRYCGLFSRSGTLHRPPRLIRLVPVTHCISGLYVFPRHIAGYGSRCITLFPGYSRPFSFHQLLRQKHSFRIGLLQRFRIYLPVIRPGKEYNSRQQKTSQKGVFMQFFLHFRPNIFIFCMIHCIMTFS